MDPDILGISAKAGPERPREQIPRAVLRRHDAFDFGHALTMHKAQGWGDVELFDESHAFREHRRRWLYTAITRAAETITIVR